MIRTGQLEGVKQSIRKLSKRGFFFSILFMLLSIAGVYSLVTSSGWSSPNEPLFKRPEIIGLIVLVLIATQGFLGALYNLLWGTEKRIIAGVNVAVTQYNFLHLLDDKCRKVILIGQNLWTPLSDPRLEFHERIISLLQRPSRPTVTIIVATHDVLKTIRHLGYPDLKQSLKKLIALRDDERLKPDEKERLQIFCHPGAVSLSCVARDPDDNQRGIFVFTPRWGTDVRVTHRLFCVIHKWEYPDLFEAIFGGIHYLSPSERETLEENLTKFASESPTI